MTNSETPDYGLIFDFDGLILDTEFPIFDAWQEIFQEHNAELTVVEWGICVGNGEMKFNPIDALEEKTGRKVDELELRQTHLDRFREKLKMEPLPGVVDLIRVAKTAGWKLSVASSSPYKWVHENLTAIGLRDQFEIIRSSDNVAKTKPDPELFLQAMEAMGTLAENTFVLEDSPHGLEAAQRSGAFGVAVPNRVTQYLDLSQASHRVNSLAEIDLQELLQLRYGQTERTGSDDE